MFDRDGYGAVQVCLLPNETLSIPFTFMSLVPFEHRSKDARKHAQVKSASRHGSEVEVERHAEEIESRAIEVKIISGSHGHIISVIRVLVFPRPGLAPAPKISTLIKY